MPPDGVIVTGPPVQGSDWVLTDDALMQALLELQEPVALLLGQL